MNCCELCGNEDADYVIDPYLQEMSGEEVYLWVCSYCYTDLILSI